jgi:hypothetical protein
MLMILIHLAKDLFVKYARFFELNKQLLEIEAIFDYERSIECKVN